MKASELRIGNLVDLGNRIAKIIEIGHLSCAVVDLEETQDTIEDYERTKPIPLTEKWLTKFGFSSKDYKEGYIGIDHKAGGMITDFVLTYPYRIGEHQKSFIWEHSNWKYNTLEYVHQLQNLYFALTGEELILNQL